MPFDVVFLEPCFPANQREFVRALAACGARVTGIGERPKSALGEDLSRWLTHYEQVGNITNEGEVADKVRFIQSKVKVDRLEAVVEAHVMCAARVREQCGIPGTSVKSTFLCRDKPAMKEALTAAGVACAQSLGSSSTEEIREFANKVGYPLVVKPRDAAGASGTVRVDSDEELRAALMSFGVDRIMFSVDYPFASNARARAFLDALPVSPADRAKIAHGNADRLLRLPTGQS